jgi:hypothetical protein
MQIVTHNNMQDVKRFEASRVVIYDNARNVIAVAYQASPEITFASTLGQPDFQQLCEQMGLATTIVADTVKPVKPEHMLFLRDGAF